MALYEDCLVGHQKPRRVYIQKGVKQCTQHLAIILVHSEHSKRKEEVNYLNKTKPKKNLVEIECFELFDRGRFMVEGVFEKRSGFRGKRKIYH